MGLFFSYRVILIDDITEPLLPPIVRWKNFIKQKNYKPRSKKEDYFSYLNLKDTGIADKLQFQPRINKSEARDRSTASSKPACHLVLGCPGIGKTRCLLELDDSPQIALVYISYNRTNNSMGWEEDKSITERTAEKSLALRITNGRRRDYLSSQAGISL